MFPHRGKIFATAGSCSRSLKLEALMSVAADDLLSVAASHLQTMFSRLEACSDAEPGLFEFAVTRRKVDNIYLFIR